MAFDKTEGMSNLWKQMVNISELSKQMDIDSNSLLLVGKVEKFSKLSQKCSIIDMQCLENIHILSWEQKEYVLVSQIFFF